jgi:hypothetical protein
MTGYKGCIWNLRFTGYFWMRSACCWHTAMTVTVPLNEITGMWRHYLWCEVLQTQVLCNPCTDLQRPLEFPGGWGSQISWHSAHEIDHVVSPSTSHLYPKEIFLVLISVTGWVHSKAKMWLEGLCQWKLLMVPTGIKPMTFQLVSQCLNWPCHPQPPPKTHITQFTIISPQIGTNICDIKIFHNIWTAQH